MRVVATGPAESEPAAAWSRRGLPWSVLCRWFAPAPTALPLALLAIVAVLSLGGCDGGGGRRPPPSPPISAPSTAAGPVVLRVSTVRGGPLLDMVARNGMTTVTSLLRGRKATIIGKGGRYTVGGRLVAVVTTSADGVRLRNPAGRTLWRATAVAGLLQIRRGETRVRYSIKREVPGRISVRRGALEIGEVRAIEAGSRIELAGGVTLGVSSSPPGDDLAVLLCREVPPDLRAVLVAAMLTRP